MKTLIKIFSIVIAASFFTTCNTTEPPDNEIKPGRRDYIWTVDTLKPAEGRSLPYSMWGGNANDVWAVGLAYLNAYCIWHYDGNNWSNYTPDKYIDPTCIWGTSTNNMWIGSTDGAFWHYDGVTWSKFVETTISGYQKFVVQSLCGNSPDNIYAVGFADAIDGSTYKGIIMHYDGTGWDLVNIPDIKNSFDQIFYDETTGKFLITGWIFNQADEYVYGFDGTNINQIFQTHTGVSINTIGSKIFSVVEGKIYKYQNEGFTLFHDFSSTNYAGAAYGRNEKDFFTINWDGIGHYNGNDLITIYPKWNNEWFPGGGIVLERDVFFIWDDSYKTFIVHGRLNN
jgi:hypothetical protein